MTYTKRPLSSSIRTLKKSTISNYTLQLKRDKICVQTLNKKDVQKAKNITQRNVFREILKTTVNTTINILKIAKIKKKSGNTKC